jgi:hypothetical protein
MRHKLQRITFQKIIYESLADFLNNDIPIDPEREFAFLEERKEFDPLEICNRVENIYVPDGLWKRLLSNHLNKHKYN